VKCEKCGITLEVRSYRGRPRKYCLSCSGYKTKEKNDSNLIPKEIDEHFELFGKKASEVEYGESCPICNSRIDEFGYCACEAGGT